MTMDSVKGLRVRIEMAGAFELEARQMEEGRWDLVIGLVPIAQIVPISNPPTQGAVDLLYTDGGCRKFSRHQFASTNDALQAVEAALRGKRPLP